MKNWDALDFAWKGRPKTNTEEVPNIKSTYIECLAHPICTKVQSSNPRVIVNTPVKFEEIGQRRSLSGLTGGKNPTEA